MPFHNPLLDLPFEDLFSTLLPDFVLSFTLFTAYPATYMLPRPPLIGIRLIFFAFTSMPIVL